MNFWEIVFKEEVSWESREVEDDEGALLRSSCIALAASMILWLAGLCAQQQQPLPLPPGKSVITLDCCGKATNQLMMPLPRWHTCHVLTLITTECLSLAVASLCIFDIVFTWTAYNLFWRALVLEKLMHKNCAGWEIWRGISHLISWLGSMG